MSNSLELRQEQAQEHAFDIVKRETPHFRADVVFWLLGLVALVVLAVIVHIHTAPFPFELAFTKNIQGPHTVPCVAPQPNSLVQSLIFLVSDLNNPVASLIDGAVWLVVFLLLRWFLALALFHRRRGEQHPSLRAHHAAGGASAPDCERGYLRAVDDPLLQFPVGPRDSRRGGLRLPALLQLLQTSERVALPLGATALAVSRHPRTDDHWLLTCAGRRAQRARCHRGLSCRLPVAVPVHLPLSLGQRPARAAPHSLETGVSPSIKV